MLAIGFGRTWQANAKQIRSDAQELWHKAQKAGEAADQAGDEGYVHLGEQYTHDS